MPVGEDVKRKIEAAVRSALPNFAVRSVKVYTGEDHDGDPALFVEVSHDLSRDPIDPKALSALIERLRRELSEVGESRFPLIRHRFDDNQKVVGFS